MSPLDPDLKRLAGWARLTACDPATPLPPGLATRVLAEMSLEDPPEISGHWLGAIFLTSAAIALAWVFVLFDNGPASADQTFTQIATRMVTQVGR